mmetsp:Transcript_8966/g.25818  ORF Transcript_8966/g.25818 Transcript_8966/m.25818 type:complete len:97 (+) Transcript_8966:4813-5103(+)
MATSSSSSLLAVLPPCMLIFESSLWTAVASGELPAKRSDLTPSIIAGTDRILDLLHLPIQRIVHLVKRAGLDSQRMSKFLLVGSIATQRWIDWRIC